MYKKKTLMNKAEFSQSLSSEFFIGIRIPLDSSHFLTHSPIVLGDS